MRIAHGLLVALALACPGCVFTWVTEPLDVRLDETRVPPDSAAGSIKHLSLDFDVEWGVAGIGAVARRHGIDRVQFADVTTLSVLGIWRQRWVEIYGTGPDGTRPAEATSP